MGEAEPVPQFVMYGSRAAMAAGLFHIEQQVKGIEQAVNENPGEAFDLARTLIESACRTILKERSVTYAPEDDLPKLIKSARDQLSLLPATASGESKARKSLAQTLGGLSMAVQGICELRNAFGFASHGADSARPQMESLQALFVAETADTIIGFLYRAHRQDRTPQHSQRPGYAANTEFNESVDALYERVVIFDEEFEPSKVLFEMAPEAYRIHLAEFEPESDIDEQGSDGTGPQEQAP